MDEKKARVSEWFSALQTQLIDIFEGIEKEVTLAQYDQPPSEFVRKSWIRDGGGEVIWPFSRGGCLKKQA